MKTTINNTEVRISFPKYVPISIPEATSEVSQETYRRVEEKLEALENRLTFYCKEFDTQTLPEPYTVCCVISTGEGDSKKTLARSFAVCSKKDRYCKIVGEKIALSRALQSLQLDKVQRKALWDDYFVSSRDRRRFHKELLLKKEEVNLQTH